MKKRKILDVYKCMNASKECIKMIGHITLYLLIYFKIMFGKNFDDIIFPLRYPKTRMRWWRESSTGYWRPPPTSPTRWTLTLSTTSPPPWGRLWRRSSRQSCFISSFLFYAKLHFEFREQCTLIICQLWEFFLSHEAMCICLF